MTIGISIPGIKSVSLNKLKELATLLDSFSNNPANENLKSLATAVALFSL